MSFRSVFIALVIGFGLVIAGLLINRQRPAVETAQPSAAFVRASGSVPSATRSSSTRSSTSTS